MLCKKCKTAVMESDTVCGYCGNEIKKSNYIRLIYIASAVVVFLMFASLGNLLSEKDIINVDTGDIPPETNGIQNNENIVQATERPTPTPFVAFDSVDDRDELIALTENLAKAASKYVNERLMYIYFLSKNGYLFDDVSNKYISQADLIDIEGYSNEFSDEQALILYIRASEFTATDTDGEDPDRMEVFCAYESMRGFYISSPDGYIGIIARESLREVLLKYNQNNGSVVRFPAKSDTFKAVGNAVMDYESTRSEITVRYSAGNDKYAFVVASFEGHTNIIKEYALIYEDDKWSVFSAGFEDRYDYKAVVNKAQPAFDIDIFPSYNLYFHSKFMRDDFKNIIAVINEKEYVTESDGALIFACGTDLFTYLEYSNGRKILCYTPLNAEMSAYPIANYIEGENVMRVLSKDPPFFILKQD